MRIMFRDKETGLPPTMVKMLKSLEAENQLLRDENTLLKERVQLLETVVQKTVDGALVANVKITPSRIEAQQPYTLTIGSTDNPAADIIIANITISSKSSDKTDVSEVDEQVLAALQLPKPKRYRRAGRWEIGFLAEEMPDILKTSEGGLDFKALVTYLAVKLMFLERVVLGGGGGDELAAENRG
ncbi:MAG: tail fiber domain-containing protein [Candidatus Caldarchaeum sp.]